MNRFITSVLFGLVTINAVVMADPSRPRLVVGIVVDQLRTDYIEYLRNHFGEKGFLRLMKDGLYLRDVDFRRSVSDPAAATAVVFTGAWPSATGVPSANVFDPASHRNLPALTDPAQMGNFTGETYSPVPLRLSTISDELAIDGAGLSAIYSVAPDAQTAVIMAGHAGNSAAWICDNTGKWASTAYYKDFPQTLTTRNLSTPLSRRLDTIQWKPALPIACYPGVPAQKRQYDFRHTFPTSDRDAYRRFKESAPVNAEVTDVAIDCLRSLHLGNRGDAIDMLNVGYTAAPYKYVRDNDYRIELEDTYIRLDGQLGRLFDAIDREVGLDNTLIFLTSTGYYDDAAPDDERYRIPGGEVSLKRAESLLNSYLSAKHGNADYVDAIGDGKLYLNHKQIETLGLDLRSLRADAAAFLMKMSGVDAVYSLDDILTGRTPATEALRLRTDPKTAADLWLEFTPGWTVADDTAYPVVKRTVRLATPLTPAFLLSPWIPAQTVATPVEAISIAPTVSGALHIRAPAGAGGRQIAY